MNEKKHTHSSNFSLFATLITNFVLKRAADCYIYLHASLSPSLCVYMFL